MPERIQRKREQGWRMPEGAVYVGRPATDWCNPFEIGKWLHVDYILGGEDSISVEIDRPLAVALYRAYVKQRGFDEDIRHALAGKDLACWCPLDEPCHADVLLEIANEGGQP